MIQEAKRYQIFNSSLDDQVTLQLFLGQVDGRLEFGGGLPGHGFRQRPTPVTRQQPAR